MARGSGGGSSRDAVIQMILKKVREIQDSDQFHREHLSILNHKFTILSDAVMHQKGILQKLSDSFEESKSQSRDEMKLMMEQMRQMQEKYEKSSYNLNPTLTGSNGGPNGSKTGGNGGPNGGNGDSNGEGGGGFLSLLSHTVEAIKKVFGD
ncbi:hypothetical protein V6N13_063338 [Hibiscus sabdariffa]|uniref:Uncharacterized protein n=2 Tax=Hibiscus sabdariffa TaxID=183260 RepID=A0ABR2C4T7_9ROSI